MISRRERQEGGHFRLEYTRTFWTRKAVSALFAIFLLIAFAACSTGNAASQASNGPTARVPLTPTTTSLPAGTVLYQANWSQGLKDWGGSKGWKIVNGMPLSDVSATNALTVPYIPAVHNYAFECRFQIVQVPHTGGYFIIKAPKTADKDGYTAGLLGLFPPSARTSPFGNPEALIYLDPAGDMQSHMAPIDYDPGNKWHTYRVQVKGPVGDLFIDGSDSSTAVSDQTDWLSNGPLQLISSGAVVRISNVTITAL